MTHGHRFGDDVNTQDGPVGSRLFCVHIQQIFSKLSTAPIGEVGKHNKNMTTNVYDGNTATLATDSRWSIPYGDWVFYLDDTGYEKLEIIGSYALMFAGKGRVIQLFKDWMRTKPTDESGMPDPKGMSVCIVDTGTNDVVKALKQERSEHGAHFAGSGTLYSFECWMKNRNAVKSVETAKTRDLFSGGDVRFYTCVTHQNNLNLNFPQRRTITINDVDAAILKRGVVMKINAGTSTVLPFPPAASAASPEEEEVRVIREKIANGELSASSPCIGMHSDWSDSEKDDLKNAMGKLFNWK